MCLKNGLYNDMLTNSTIPQVENLDISKTTATELLKAHDADPVKAMRAWISA